MANPDVTEESVYACTGKPRPSDMERMLDWLLTASFQEASDRILTVQREQGVSLVDIVHGVGERVMALEMPPACKYALLDRLSDVECVPAPINVPLRVTVPTASHTHTHPPSLPALPAQVQPVLRDQREAAAGRAGRRVRTGAGRDGQGRGVGSTE